MEGPIHFHILMRMNTSLNKGQVEVVSFVLGCALSCVLVVEGTSSTVSFCCEALAVIMYNSYLNLANVTLLVTSQYIFSLLEVKDNFCKHFCFVSRIYCSTEL